MTDKKAIATAPDKPTEHKALSAKERRERAEEEANYVAGRPMRDWKVRMERTDKLMNRAIEDIIDALPASVRNNIASVTLDRYNEKKQIRSEKPE